MLDFCSKHSLSSDIETIPIQKVNEAYERVVKSDVRYRFVIDMKSLYYMGRPGWSHHWSLRFSKISKEFLFILTLSLRKYE